MTEQEQLKEGAELKEHEFCLRCGRRLKNVDSRRLGYGKICVEKLSVEIKRPLFKK